MSTSKYFKSNIFYTFSKNTSLIIVIIGISISIASVSSTSSPTEIPKGTLLSYFSLPQTLVQQSTFNNKEHTISQASGHFANNQIREGMVTWIQCGLWNLQ